MGDGSSGVVLMVLQGAEIGFLHPLCFEKGPTVFGILFILVYSIHVYISISNHSPYITKIKTVRARFGDRLLTPTSKA
jgi:hypothetical protein